MTEGAARSLGNGVGWNVDLEVRRGGWTGRFVFSTPERWVIVRGPSGGGKSSLIRALAGLGQVSGAIQVGGQVWDGATPAEDRGLGWCPQDATLFPHLNVRQNLELAGGVDEPTLTALGLDVLLERFPRSLSGGERQRVALARALRAGRGVLVLDEPFSALNEEMRSVVWTALKNQATDRNLHVLLSTHDTTSIQIPHLELLVEDGRTR